MKKITLPISRLVPLTFKGVSKKKRSLTNLQTEAIQKGLKYLEFEFNSSQYPFSSNYFGTSRDDMKRVHQFKFTGLKDTFNLYILTLLLERHLPSKFRAELFDTLRTKKGGTLNFFADTDTNFPDDSDTTAVGYSAMLQTNSVTKQEIASIAQRTYENVNEDGVVMSYYVPEEDSRYNRLDAVNIINVILFAYQQGHENCTKRSEDYVFHWLNSGSYKSGTLYYPSPLAFLYFCSKLASTNHVTKQRFTHPLRREFNQITEKNLKFPLDYAFFVLMATKLGMRNESLIEKLIRTQNDDGSWPADALFCTHETKTHFGSTSISTIFSVLALIETNCTIYNVE